MQIAPVMQQLPSPGASVVVRDELWRVSRVDAFERCAVVTLEGAGRRRLRVIEPFDSIASRRRPRIRRRRRRAVVEAALKAIRAQRQPLTLWTAGGAAIDLMPYQLEPALAVLRGATRLLLADAVGLGKTIQAGLILSELRERGWVERALIVCPPGVRHEWARELEMRFGIACAVVDQSALAESAATLPPGINPWSTHATVVTSIDFAKRPDVMSALSAVPIDIVIADEAHHLTPGTDRGEAFNRLASRAPWCVLVSATPHSGDQAAFDFLSGIGSHRDPLTIFRRSRRDAGLAASRRERIVRVHATAEETELFAAVDRYARAIWQGGGADPVRRLVAITIARRAASSALALERTLRRRLSLISAAPEPAQAVLPWDETDESDGSGAPDLLARVGLDNGASERAAIEQLLALIDRCHETSKLQWIARMLARIRDPAVVFTEYRDTLDAVVAALPSGVRVASMCGATPLDARRGAVDAFNRGGVDVLVATDTAGEGLNLHHRCRLVVDVELPWNPIRLEQRIGRVDRLGQRRRVHALRLIHPGTVEERVLERVRMRRRCAEMFEPRPIDERVIAEAIFESADIASAPAPAVTGLVVAGAAAEHARLVRQRTTGNAALHAGIACAPKRSTTTAMVAVHHVSYANEFGSTVGGVVCAHVLQVDAARLRRRKEWLDAIAGSRRLERLVHVEMQARCDAIARDLAPLRTSLSSRIASIRAQLAAQRTVAVQRSLFDRLAEVEAARLDAAGAALDAALVRRRLSINSPVTPDLAHAVLIALWPAARR